MNTVLEQFRAAIETATATHQPLQLRGGGTKQWYGQQLAGQVLDTRPYRGVIAYDPAELVITARCGTPLAEIEAVLAEKNQLLPFEPPYFGPHATFGGCVAAGLSGPRRQAAGAVRDFVLGASLMDGKGQVLIRERKDMGRAFAEMLGQSCIIEAFVEFTRELSIICVRGLRRRSYSASPASTPRLSTAAARVTASSNAWQAPWPRFGAMACAASPRIATFPLT